MWIRATAIRAVFPAPAGSVVRLWNVKDMPIFVRDPVSDVVDMWKGALGIEQRGPTSCLQIARGFVPPFVKGT